jgi:predicted TIM-barrel fold metal-dependent hydrolase
MLCRRGAWTEVHRHPDGKGWYYDHERYLPFWERAESLGVPVYLHPRNPLPANAGI